MKSAFALVALLALSLPAATIRMASEPYVDGRIEELRAQIAELAASGANGGAVVSADNTVASGPFTATYELCTVPALVATNSVHASVTNGTLFAYVADGRYVNAPLGEEIRATQTNFVWRGIGSSVVDGLDAFGGAFSVAGRFIAPSQAEALK